jgi:hypothetical protein
VGKQGRLLVGLDIIVENGSYFECLADRYRVHIGLLLRYLYLDRLILENFILSEYLTFSLTFCKGTPFSHERESSATSKLSTFGVFCQHDVYHVRRRFKKIDFLLVLNLSLLLLLVVILYNKT